MSKDTFILICHELQPHFSKEYTRMTDPVSTEKRLAINFGNFQPISNTEVLLNCFE